MPYTESQLAFGRKIALEQNPSLDGTELDQAAAAAIEKAMANRLDYASAGQTRRRP